jgi:antibiotic biosynthesis monooxygenase (ABM) superfamily enzyme
VTNAAPGPSRSVSILTQTRVRPEHNEDFARWQGETSNSVSRFPGFLEQQLLPPNPPLQVDWVILQRFASLADAQRWLGSAERQTRIAGAAPMLVGRDDVHIVQDEANDARPAPVSTIISTRIKPGKDAEYLEWVRRIAAAQSKAPGLQGYRFEPPVPGVQEHFIAILRFDTEANLRPGSNRRYARPFCGKQSRSPRNPTRASRARASSSGSATSPPATDSCRCGKWTCSSC